MTKERAIEILNPEHREHYPNVDIVNEACRMGMEALEKQIPKKPIIKKDKIVFGIVCGNCPTCQSGIYSSTNNFCHKCGQALDWSD